MTVYVSRSGGVITGVFARPQSGVAEEAIDDAVAEVVAFLNPTPKTVRELAALLLGLADPVAQDVRAAALLMMDELNAVRQWITDFKAAVAAATTLADLKTRVAALVNLPQRNALQIKPALATRVNTPDADA